MTRRSLLVSFSVTPLLATATPMPGGEQGGQERKSPHETVSVEVGGKKVQITYGRPSLKGRKAFTGELAPNGQVWRLGADEATKVELSAPAVFNGTLQVPAGSYAMFAIPGTSEWTVIVNKTANQWGAFNYSEGQDLGRFKVPVKKAANVEEFTIKLAKGSGDTATVSMMWQDADIEFPIKFS